MLRSLCILITLSHNIKEVFTGLPAFDDSILYRLKWPGKDGKSLLDGIEDSNLLTAVSSRKEKYQCAIPPEVDKENAAPILFSKPNPMEAIMPLFSAKVCSYRMEGYWSYELCHGRFIKQFYEPKNDQDTEKRQEYMLGVWDEFLHYSHIEQFEKLLGRVEKEVMPRRKVDGVMVPYMKLNYTGGSPCEITDMPRQTDVLYVCSESSAYDIHSLKEVYTCHYEVIVFTAMLCLHPSYKPKKQEYYDINCLPMEGFAKKPRDLLAMEANALQSRMQEAEGSNKVYAIFTVDPGTPDSPGKIRVEFRTNAEKEKTNLVVPVTEAEVKKFISGADCLRGGQGWWTYEFCYGKYVQQVHYHDTGEKITVRLGNFIEKNHREFMNKNSQLRMNAEIKKHVIHYYSDGDYCPEAEKHRTVKVKLMCPQKKTSAVSLYLLEPSTCSYEMGIEDPIICKLLPYLDEDGLLKDYPFSESSPKQ